MLSEALPSPTFFFMILYYLLAILGVICELAMRHEQRTSRTYPLRVRELVKVNFPRQDIFRSAGVLIHCPQTKR